MEAEVAPCEQIDHQVHISGIMKSILDIDNEVGVRIFLVDSPQKFQLLHNALHAVLVHDTRFKHFFHCELFPLSLHNVDLPEPPTADGSLNLEAFDRQLFISIFAFASTISHDEML